MIYFRIIKSSRKAIFNNYRQLLYSICIIAACSTIRKPLDRSGSNLVYGHRSLGVTEDEGILWSKLVPIGDLGEVSGRVRRKCGD